MDRPEPAPNAGAAATVGADPVLQRGRRRDGSVSPRPDSDALSQIIDAISAILVGMDGDGAVTLWNPAAAGTLGVPASKAIGRPLLDCGVRWDTATIARALSACAAGDTPQRLDDLRYTRPDGREGFLGVTLVRYGARDGGRGRSLLLGADTTERHMLTSQLAQAQKLESIGQLAAGIAHEINTPIQYVGDNLRFLQDAWVSLLALLEDMRGAIQGLRDGSVGVGRVLESLEAMESRDTRYVLEEVPMAIADALEGAGRVSEIVRAMRDYSHPALGEKTAMDVNRAIESTITVARSEWKSVADVVTDLDRDLPLVPCLPAELNQVILNILINAVHAIGDVVDGGRAGKGTITVTTRAAGSWAEIRIKDTGKGMCADIRDRVFDPFFTTKEVGRGTGQGLAIAHTVIVEKHGGTITFDTEPGRGTTFVIRLPIECDAVPRGTTQ